MRRALYLSTTYRYYPIAPLFCSESLLMPIQGSQILYLFLTIKTNLIDAKILHAYY